MRQPLGPLRSCAVREGYGDAEEKQRGEPNTKPGKCSARTKRTGMSAPANHQLRPLSPRSATAFVSQILNFCVTCRSGFLRKRQDENRTSRQPLSQVQRAAAR